MSGAAGLDVRFPIGGLFTVLGLLLAAYGLATADEPARYARSLSVNINLWWGAVMLAFGLVLLWGATHGRRKVSARPAAETNEGRAIEAREHRAGLER